MCVALYALLCLGAPASFFAWGNSDDSLQHQRVHTGGLMEGHSGGLLWRCSQSGSITWPTNNMTSPFVDLWWQGPDSAWTLDVVEGMGSGDQPRLPHGPWMW